MPIACDTCGKVATIAGKPDDMHWFKWMMDESRGDDAIVALPANDTEIGVICMACLRDTLADWNESRTDADDA